MKFHAENFLLKQENNFTLYDCVFIVFYFSFFIVQIGEIRDKIHRGICFSCF